MKATGGFFDNLPNYSSQLINLKLQTDISEFYPQLNVHRLQPLHLKSMTAVAYATVNSEGEQQWSKNSVKHTLETS